jgi:acyl-phosphate glycerol 3-phosphate acyltransferase
MIESMTPAIALAIAAAYVVGSIDFAVIVARMHGIDIHEVGSGNPGASNVLRSVGRFPAAMVLVGDTMKGVVGAAMGMIASGTANPQSEWAFLAGLAAVVGHCYPVFHRFKGGKGVATGLGVLMFTVPVVALIDLAAWVLLLRSRRRFHIFAHRRPGLDTSTRSGGCQRYEPRLAVGDHRWSYGATGAISRESSKEARVNVSIDVAVIGSGRGWDKTARVVQGLDHRGGPAGDRYAVEEAARAAPERR